jgi:hypothetical protein
MSNSTSTVTYRYENNKSFKKDGIKHLYKELIIDGPKGLTVEYLKKEGDNEFHRLTIREKQNEPDKFIITEKKNNDNLVSNEKSGAEFKKMLKDNKVLSFAINYVDKERGKYKGLESNDPEIVKSQSYTAKKMSKKTSKQPKKISKIAKKVTNGKPKKSTKKK